MSDITTPHVQPMNHEEMWKNALTELELSISRAGFVTWFRDTSIADFNDGVMTISVPSGFAKNWLQDKYHRSILRVLRGMAPDIREVSYVVGAADRNVLSSRPKVRTQPRPAFMESQARFDLKESAVDPESGLNPRYLFENFVVGSFNELAHAAAQAVAKNLGTTYNPLFIWGGVGLGKTHLIQAIGNSILKENPTAKIRYIPSERYMGEIVDAINDKTMNQLKERYRSIDLLIMDDIQFIAKTEKMQEEFFHVFNALFEKNRQIVISSDKPPAAIPTLEQRLKSRFEGGMLADIGEPDMETRLAILKTKLKSKNVAIPDNVLQVVAESVTANIRDLEGALNRLILRTTMSSTPLDVEETKKILAAAQHQSKRFASPKKIIRTVAEFYDVSEKELIDHSRKKEIVKPRQIAMYLLREELKCSFPFIGEKLGKKDHTTAIHAYKKVLAALASNPDFELELKALKEKIYATV